MEEQVDDEIKNLEKLDEDDLEAIKRRRLGIPSITLFSLLICFKPAGVKKFLAHSI